MPSDDDDDRYDEADLDERLSRVFEERGWPTPAACRADDRRAAPTPADAVPSPAAPPAPATPAPSAAPPLAAPAVKSAAPARTPGPVAPAPRRSAGREKVMLLGLLGTLAGAFAGVLSLKLLVPRPPTGTGPDVHLASAAATPLDLVEPPALTAPPQAPPSLPDPFRSLAVPAGNAAPDRSPDGVPEPPRSRFAAPPENEPLPLVADPPPPAEPPSFDGGLSPANPPDLDPVPTASQSTPSRRGVVATVPPDDTRSPDRPATASAAAPRTILPVAGTTGAGVDASYVVREGDSWWSIAEGAYGDGRLYKALFAWNRTVDPRTSLAPGTRLEVPDEPRLRAAWGRLVPAAAADGR